MSFYGICVYFCAFIVALNANQINETDTHSSHPVAGHRNRRICHLRNVEKCIDNVSKLGKEPNPTSIIATEESFNKLCGYV